MDESVKISSAEEQLCRFGSFLENNDKKLNSLLNEWHLNSSIKLNKRPIIEIIYGSNQENLPLLRFLESDRILNKSILTFAYICSEIDDIIKDCKCMQQKFIYIDDELRILSEEVSNISDKGMEQSTQNVLLKMSTSMEFICNINFLLQRCIVLGNNLLHQCGAFLGADEKGPSLEFKLYDVFDYLSKLLLQIVIFDELLQLSNFRQYWPLYMMTVQQLSPISKVISSAEIRALRGSLKQLKILFNGVFKNFMESTFGLKEKIGPKGMGSLMLQFNEYMKQSLAFLDKLNFNDVNSSGDPHLLVCINAFCVVFHDFCGQVESKHIKHLLELNNKHQGIMLVGNISWKPSVFIKKHAETLVKSHEKLLADFSRQLKYFLQTSVKNLERDARQQCIQIAQWNFNICRALNRNAFDLKVEQFKELATLILLGLKYCQHISFRIKAIINTHVLLQIPMAKQTLLSVCKYIEMLKLVQLVFQENNENISRVMQCILQYLQYKILHLFAFNKKRITISKLHDCNVDSLAAIKIAEKCMNGPCTNLRILITKLAINSTNLNSRTVTNEQYEKFKTIIQHIEILSKFQEILIEICDTSFIYWHQSILTVYLKQIIDQKLNFKSFQHLVKASNQCKESMNRLHLDKLKLNEIVDKTIFDNLRSEIISNLCAQIEIFLRLEVHSNLQLEKMNPFEQSLNDYRDLIEIEPIPLNGRYIILKDHIENYLSVMFYNLTTISLHDWKTYEEMRHLANQRLNLNPIDDYLPNQTIEQGIDILEIMRNIHIFVSKYVYNMNSQIFVEQQSSNKHLDTIGISHVANSIRTHGTGVINTTVNFTYQFLRQKFYTFSQFLYDEQIKSRLMKEFRTYSERKQNNNYPLYSYERADSFNKDIRKLGKAREPFTYMDLFRKVITHVGNAMGYIRLVRSGSIDATYSASLYLPKFDDNLKFVELCKKMKFHDVTVTAATTLEANITNLLKNFSDSTDYFKLLAQVFQPFFQNARNMHLKNFFLIVPPLTLNYVQYMISVKEKISKKDHQEGVLFDDGFTLGLVYVLKSLNQFTDFNALQWFTTLRERFTMEQRKIADMLSDIKKESTKLTAQQKSENEKLQQTLALTERRINSYQKEFNLLYYNMTSAKIFFQ